MRISILVLFMALVLGMVMADVITPTCQNTCNTGVYSKIENYCYGLSPGTQARDYCIRGLNFLKSIESAPKSYKANCLDLCDTL